jgi:PAS domain S-box-containing protein
VSVAAGHLLERVFEEASDAIFVADPCENRLLAANPACAALLGYTVEELLALPISEIHPADFPQVHDFLERVLREGQGSTVKLACRAKSGVFLPTEITLFTFESGGSPLVLGLIRDRSEHRQRVAC